MKRRVLTSADRTGSVLKLRVDGTSLSIRTSMQMSAMQLSGSAPGGLQLPKARIGGVFNMGGAAVANYVSILEPLR